VTTDHCIGSDDTTFTDVDPLENTHACTDPDIGLEDDRCCLRGLFVEPLVRIDQMVLISDRAVFRHYAVRTYFYRLFRTDHGMAADERIVPQHQSAVWSYLESTSIGEHDAVSDHKLAVDRKSDVSPDSQPAPTLEKAQH
jgi:hypothetical protein